MMSFVAINYINCNDSYVSRFEELFKTRAHAIDRMKGFLGMQVLKPKTDGEPYLVVSQWESEECFKDWTDSEEFREGHKRAFADLKAAKERGEATPMHSKFETYQVLAT